MENQPSILIIDSDLAFATMLQEGLQQGGEYRATVATRGDEALQALTADEFDLAVVDLGLTDPDGITLARALRQRQADLRFADSEVALALVQAETADRKEAWDRLERAGAVYDRYGVASRRFDLASSWIAQRSTPPLWATEADSPRGIRLSYDSLSFFVTNEEYVGLYDFRTGAELGKVDAPEGTVSEVGLVTT